MEKYLSMDVPGLEKALAACTDFKERQHIRGALRELKGIRLDGDTIRTYSFSRDSLRNKHNLPHVDNGIKAGLKTSNVDEVKAINSSAHIILSEVSENGIVLEQNNTGKTDNTRDRNERFKSFLYAGSISSPVPNHSAELEERNNAWNSVLTNRLHSDTGVTGDDIVNINTKHPKGSAADSNSCKPVHKRQTNVKEADDLIRYKEHSKLPGKSQSETNGWSAVLYADNDVVKETVSPERLPVKHPPDKVVLQPDVHNSRITRSAIEKCGITGSNSQDSETNQSNSQQSAHPKKPRKISYRTSPFSGTSTLSPISSTVSKPRLGSEPQRCQSVNETTGITKRDTRSVESVRRCGSVNEVDGIFKCRPAVVVADDGVIKGAGMKAEINNKLSSHKNISGSVVGRQGDTRRMMSQDDEVNDNKDNDRIPQKSKSSLSRKKRVESDSPRMTRIIRKNDKISESSELPNKKSSNGVYITQESNNADKLQSAKVVTKSGSVRRKLPQVPVKTQGFEDEEEESIHDRTIRLLQERRKGRLQKNEQETPTEKVKVKASPEEIMKTLEEKLERSDSQRKACRVRRELQLLQRDCQSRSRSPSPSYDLRDPELGRSRTPVRVNRSIEKENRRQPVQRSKSDIVRRRKSRNESETSVIPDGLPPKVPVAEVVTKETSDEPELDFMTPERKINIIGSLMQEEARLQELLRRSTNFSEKRRMRSEVKQLRERRAALEGTADVHPMALLRRSASVTAGMITPASQPKTVISPDTPEPDNSRQAIEDLRKQLNDTTDYDEKKKIRLALRQLRTQSRDGSLTPSSGLQRSQSFIIHKSSQPISNGDTSAGGVPILRSQSVTDKPRQTGVNGVEDDGSDAVVTSITNGDIANCDTKTHTLKHSSGSAALCSKPPVSSSTSSEKRESTLQRLKSLHKRKSAGDLSSQGLATRQSNDDSEKNHNNSLLINGDAGLTAKQTTLSSSSPSIVKKRHSFVEESKQAFQQDKGNTESARRHSVESGSDIRQISKDRKPSVLSRYEIFEKTDVKSNDTAKPSSILVSRANIGHQKSALINPSTDEVNVKVHSEKFVHTGQTKPRTLSGSDKQTNNNSVNNKIKTNEEVKPNIPWLENKKKSIPSDELENLLSTLDIEKAFSQILDAVETFPETTEMSEITAPVIQEEDSAGETSDSREVLDNEEQLTVSSDPKDMDCNDIKESYMSVEVTKDIVSTGTDENHEVIDVLNKDSSTDVTESASELSGDVSDVTKENSNNGTDEVPDDKGAEEDEDKSAIPENFGTKKSEAKIQLRGGPLTLDTKAASESKSAITVIRDDDGAVTVQEVNKKEEGDTTITEWRRVRRTQSRTEVRETDTITEKKGVSPGGSSTVYEKDISKTKRKLTSRGSNYFSRNNYNIRKMRDPAGEEIVEHEMTSETDNLSVSKNEAWGDKTKASVMLNRDGNEVLSLTTEENGCQDEDSREQNGNNSNMTTMSVFPSSASTQSDLDVPSVLKTQLGRPAGCPHITSPLQDTTTTEGASFMLKCMVVCAPPTTATWYKGDNPVHESDGVICQFDESCGTCCLQTTMATLKHAGNYRCEFKNSYGAASTTGVLTVKCCTQEAPSFLTELQDVSVCEGHSLTLECSVMDTDHVFWYRDGVIQRNSPDFKQTFDGSLARLEISEVYVDDFGTYSCSLKNNAGESKSSCKISVIESVSNDLVVPMFLRKPETQIVNETETAIIECDVIGSPEPTMTWSCDKLALTESDRCIMTYDGRVARLIVKRVTQRDNGKIECTAENSCGHVTADCILVVNAKKKVPSITNPLEDMTTHSGKVAILECGIMGDPEPNIIWRKNGMIIGQIFDFKHSYKNGIARLEIVKACSQDSGSYECCAINSHGEVTTSCQLTITDEVLEVSTENNLKVKVTEEKIQKATTKKFPARFVPKIDEDQIQASKRQASKIMLVRQGSLRTMKPDTQPAVVKRSGSFQIRRKFGSDLDTDTKVEAVRETSKSPQDFVKDKISTYMGSAGNRSTGVTSALEVDISSKVKSVDSAKDASGSKLLHGDKITGVEADRKVTSEQKTDINGTHNDDNKIESVDVSRKDFVKSTNLDLNKNYKTDVNSNLTKISPEENLKNGIEKSAPVKVAEKFKDDTKEKKEEIKPSLKTRYSVDTSDVKADTPLAKVKVGSEIRRSQSVRTPGSEKPEWLQVKLRKVGGGGNSDFKKFVTSPGTGSGLSKLEQSGVDKSDNTQKGSSVCRSQSVRDPEKTAGTALKDSTNSPLNTQLRNSAKITPVSERAKIFQKNENNNSPSGKSSPTEIIAKALTNLSRTESLRSPAGQRQFTVQRSHSFKTQPAVASGDITLELSKQKAEGQEVKKDSDSSRKVVKLWDPDTAPTHKMDYAKITDEEELNKLLSDSDNFDERKKIRARLKELREQAMKEWEEKKASRPPPVDLIKQKHAEADLEKKKKLEAFQKQAAEHHEAKHLDMAEQHLRDKHRQADEMKKKTLEEYDRRAGKTTPAAPKAAAGRPAEEIAPLLAQQIINATSPSVSGKLTVKTESWSSKDGITRTSERTESWGAKPVNPFKAADAAAAKTKPPGQGRAAMARSPSAIKTMLLEWTKAMTREYAPTVEITNFSTSWNDGMAFCALIHHFYPESFDFEKLDPKKRRKNFELAFDTAEKFADIAPLLDVEDMVKMKKPDWKCVFTYVQSFYRKLQNHEANKAKVAASES